ncbi:MAG: putative rane protein [Microbacteriaceae bacterium]|nr:putative rane protein [Microbacteriaceae bacterium]
MSHLDRKAVGSALVGVVLAMVPLFLNAAELAPLIGWVAAGSVFLAWAWAKAWKAGPDETRELALHEGRSRRLVDSIIIGATFLSLVFVVFALLRSQQKDPVGVLAAILATLSVVVAWALINTVYAFKYARMYYHDDNHRFRFDQEEDPSYSDFAYAAFSIGMAYNANNVDESSTPSRRIALGHGLLAYLFGTVVVAVAINLVTSLAQSG